MAAVKTLTLRLDEDRAQKLELIAEANGTSQNAVLLKAIDTEIEALRGDKAFKERVAKGIAERQRVLELLA